MAEEIDKQAIVASWSLSVLLYQLDSANAFTTHVVAECSQSDVRIACPNRCTPSSSLLWSILHEHLEKCPSQPLPCPLGCRRIIPRQNLTIHETLQCPLRMVLCDLCHVCDSLSAFLPVSGFLWLHSPRYLSASFLWTLTPPLAPKPLFPVQTRAQWLHVPWLLQLVHFVAQNCPNISWSVLCK